MRRREVISHAMAALLSLSLIVSMFGCAVKQHVGSINRFDSSTADTLHDMQGVLEGLSAHIADYPSAKPAINQAREYYTVAERTYFQWRCGIGAATTMGPKGAPCPVLATPNIITQDHVTAAIQAAQQATANAQAQATPTTGVK